MMHFIALLWILVMYFILAAAQLPSNATINSTWTTTSNTADDNMILYQFSLDSPGLACGFLQFPSCKACAQNNNNFFFSVYVLGSFPDSIGQSASGRESEIIWLANRNRPVSSNSTLELGQDGNLVLKDVDGTVAWESKTVGLGVMGMELQASGNLVLFNDKKKIVWESFSSPTDTLLTGQPLKVGSRLVSSISNRNLSDGNFYLQVEHDKVSMYAKTSSVPQEYARWCPYTGAVNFIRLDNGTLNCYNSSNSVMCSIRIPVKDVNSNVVVNNQFLRILPDGNFKFFVAQGDPEDDAGNGLVVLENFDSVKSPCGAYPGACGVYGICTTSSDCNCLEPHFSIMDQNDPTQGCSLDAPPVCSNQTHANTFIELQGMDYVPAEFGSFSPTVGSFTIDKCKSSCLHNCTCKALVFYPDTKECFQFTEIYTLWNATLDDGSMPVTFIKVGSSREDAGSPNSSLPTRSPPAWARNPYTAPTIAHHRNRFKPAYITTAILLAVGIVLLVTMITFCRNKILLEHFSKPLMPSVPNLPKLFKYQELCQITNGFKKQLGKGGFGTVFEGILSDGTKVAVKCLESARQGLKQFEAEVMTIGSIHHKNLVKLLGFGAEKSQYYLIYEFVPNLSLDQWLFKNGAHILDWEKRFNIAMDIARGLHYLHEGCQERVLHLDIKPQNILLDSSFQAKICDFGLARLIDKGQSYIDTAMRGTPGYMAPEWLHARVTEKTDVYSFGIVLLEIVSGRKTVPIPTGLSSQNMLRTKAFEQEETLVEHVDIRLFHNVGKLDMEQVKRITRIGLLCVQEDPSERPSMQGILKMMEGSMDVPYTSGINPKLSHCGLRSAL